MKRLMLLVFVPGLVGCGVSQSTHRAVVDQLAEARAQLDACRAAKVEKPRADVDVDVDVEDPPAEEKTYGQTTPREAIESFIAAYRDKRWDVMLRFVPARFAEEITEDKLRAEVEKSDEMRRNVEGIEAAGDAGIVVEGDRARMAYGDGKEVKLVREDGVWKIDDLD